MKRILSLVFALCLIGGVFAGCGKTPDVDETLSTTEAEKAEYTVNIDGNKFTEDFSEESFYETLNSIDGLFCTKNDETNKYTLKMTLSAYTKLKEIKAKEVYGVFDELKKDTENYVTDITYDEDFRKVTIVAEREKTPEEINYFDSTVVKVAGAVMSYQMYTVYGQGVSISVVYSDDEQVVAEILYPIVITE